MKKPPITETETGPEPSEPTPTRGTLDVGEMLQFEYQNGLMLGLFAGFCLAIGINLIFGGSK